MDTHKPHKISWLSKAFVTIGLGAIGSLLATMIWESSLCATWRKDNPIDTLLGSLGPQIQKYGIGFVGFVMGSSVSLVYYLLKRRGDAVIHPQAIYSTLTTKPTPQQVRQQRINEQMEVLSQFPKPSQNAFEALKFLAMNPRDATLDIHGVASLYYDGNLEAAKSCLQELIGLDYIQRAGPATPGEWQNHYQITKRGFSCVDIYAT